MIRSCFIRIVAEGGAITNSKRLRVTINGHYDLTTDRCDGVHMIHKQAMGKMHWSAHVFTVVFVTLFASPCTLASGHAEPDKQIQSILKITPSTSHDYFRILSARSFGLPDSATSEQIQKATIHAEYIAEAKMCGWSLNLSDTEYGALSEQRRKLELAAYGYPEVAEDKISQALLTAKEAVMFAPRNLSNSIVDITPTSCAGAINEGLMEYEQAWRLFAEKQAAGLPPWASQKQLESVQHERLRTVLAKGLHLKPNASFEEINIAQAKNGKLEHSLLLHRMFKASSAVPDAELEKQLKPLAKALGYPILRGTNCAGSRVSTADDLLSAAVRSPVAQPAHGLAGAPAW